MQVIKRMMLVVVVLLATIVTKAQAEQYPQPTGYVNDFANIIPVAKGQALNQELVAYEQRTSIEISVVTIPSLNGRDIESFTVGLATKWGVGKAGANNGVVFLIAVQDHKMWIQAASGVHGVLTDERIQRIIGDDVRPRFQAGDFPGGIIAGTRSIMTMLDPANIQAQRESTPAVTPTRPMSTEDKQTIMWIVFGLGFGGVFLLWMMPRFKQAIARTEFFRTRGSVAQQLANLQKTASNTDVTDETRQELAGLENSFGPMRLLTADDPHVNWRDVNDRLNTLYTVILDTIHQANKDIAQALRARQEGPKLMAKMPELLAAAEKKLAEGKSSDEAKKNLAEARSKYDDAQRQQSGMSIINWIILYSILTDAQNNCAQAESAHTYANTDHHQEYSSHRSSESESSSSSSFGFGDSGGFGGGGGFSSGSGGGGAGGGW